MFLENGPGLLPLTLILKTIILKVCISWGANDMPRFREYRINRGIYAGFEIHKGKPGFSQKRRQKQE
jgi:hypothetical protein